MAADANKISGKSLMVIVRIGAVLISHVFQGKELQTGVMPSGLFSMASHDPKPALRY
jgi:hypothetical protein